MAQIKTNLQYGVTGSLQTGSIAGDAIDGTKIADDAINSEHLAAGGIDTAHIADDQITLAKMATGTDGNIITYDASGNPAVVATGASGQLLQSAGAGRPPVMATVSTGITHFDTYRATSESTGVKDPITGWESPDDASSAARIGAAMSASSGVWTFPTTGKWLVDFTLECYDDAEERQCYVQIGYSTDSGSSWDNVGYSQNSLAVGSSSNYTTQARVWAFCDVTNVSTHRVKAHFNPANNNVYMNGQSATNATMISFTRMGDT